MIKVLGISSCLDKKTLYKMLDQSKNHFGEKQDISFILVHTSSSIESMLFYCGAYSHSFGCYLISGSSIESMLFYPIAYSVIWVLFDSWQ